MSDPIIYSTTNTTMTLNTESAGFRGIFSASGEPLMTWTEFDQRVEAMAVKLSERGAAVGGRVLAWLARGWEEAVLCAATRKIGAVWLSVPKRSSPAQVIELLKDAEPRVAVCGARERARLEYDETVSWCEWPELAADFSAEVNVNAPSQQMPAQMMARPAHPADSADSGQLAALCYTSGSTGRPKGVMVTVANLAGAVERVDAYLKNTTDDRLLALMPLNAPWGLLQWMSARRAGASIVLPPAVAMGGELAKTIRAAGVTGLAALPPTWVQLVDYLQSRGETLPELRYVTTSGGIIPFRILDLFTTVFPRAEIWMTYGLTEAFRTTVVPATEFALRRGSLGRPCDGVRIEILRPDGSRTAVNEVGELVHVGECVTSGYWRRPEETRRAFALRATDAGVLGAGPVHYSGDRVRRDEEGYLWFEGRDDGLIKTGGYRVSAEEIETVLLGINGVRNAVVFGIPDEALGQRIAAWIELDASAKTESFDVVPIAKSEAAEVALNAARAALRQSLGSHQQPHVLRVWSGAIPLTANGKIDRPTMLTFTLQLLSENPPK